LAIINVDFVRNQFTENEDADVTKVRYLKDLDTMARDDQCSYSFIKAGGQILKIAEEITRNYQ
jgi:hypothetical protein